METILEKESIADVENTISDIDGIESARIVANGQDIEEIQVTTGNGKKVAQIARDIEAALIFKHGIAIDYRKITIDEAANKKEQKASNSRLRIKSVSVETYGPSCKVGVSLFHHNQDLEGFSKGSFSSSNKLKLIAEATLNALENISNQASFALSDIVAVNVGSKNIICVSVSINHKGIETNLTGSAFKKEGQESEAIVKATLAAVNRKINLISD